MNEIKPWMVEWLRNPDPDSKEVPDGIPRTTQAIHYKIAAAIESTLSCDLGEGYASGFLQAIIAEAHLVRDPKKERVPPGTKWCGTLWLAPDGELVCSDGSPQTEAHNCDALGCSSVTHVVARLASHPPGEPDGINQDALRYFIEALVKGDYPETAINEITENCLNAITKLPPHPDSLGFSLLTEAMHRTPHDGIWDEEKGAADCPDASCPRCRLEAYLEENEVNE